MGEAKRRKALDPNWGKRKPVIKESVESKNNSTPPEKEREEQRKLVWANEHFEGEEVYGFFPRNLCIFRHTSSPDYPIIPEPPENILPYIPKKDFYAVNKIEDFLPTGVDCVIEVDLEDTGEPEGMIGNFSPYTFVSVWQWVVDHRKRTITKQSFETLEINDCLDYVKLLIAKKQPDIRFDLAFVSGDFFHAYKDYFNNEDDFYIPVVHHLKNGKLLYCLNLEDEEIQTIENLYDIDASILAQITIDSTKKWLDIEPDKIYSFEFKRE